MKKWVIKNYKWMLIIAIILFGIFLRSYEFSNWLHFELDQSRDAKVIDLAVKEGPGYLPLLGPRAGGTFLRLGPVFYYMEYLSALVFGDTPAGIAMVVLLFAIASIPLFYFLCREYFNQKISLFLTAVFTLSFYLIAYSRFAWNPNTVPFFTILIFLSMIKVSNSDEKRKDIWAYILAASLAMTFQLHFLFMLASGMFFIIFFAISRPKLKIKTWAICAAIFLLINLPMIINDIKTGGKNFQEFFGAVTSKSETSKKNNFLIKKIYRDFSEHSAKYSLILLGNEQLDLTAIKFSENKWYKPKLVCKDECAKNLPMEILGMIIFAGGSGLLIYRFKREKDDKRKKFLMANIIYLGVVFAVFIPLALYLSPRFFIVSAIMPFIFLGLFLEFIDSKNLRFKNWIIAGIVLAIILSNLYFVRQYFTLLKNAPTEPMAVNTDLFVDESAVITLQQQKIIDEYIKGFYEKNRFPVYISSDPRHERALLYHLERWGVKQNNLNDNSTVYRNGNYFLIYPTLSNSETEKKKFADKFITKEVKEFGSLTVFHIIPKEEAVEAEEQTIKSVISSSKIGTEQYPRRYRWNEIFKSNDFYFERDVEE